MSEATVHGACCTCEECQALERLATARRNATWHQDTIAVRPEDLAVALRRLGMLK